MKIYVTPYESIDVEYYRASFETAVPKEAIRIDEDGAFIGTHDFCKGVVSVIDVGKLVRAMVCQCGLRVLFPKTLKTVADLDRWAKEFWPMPAPDLTNMLPKRVFRCAKGHQQEASWYQENTMRCLHSEHGTGTCGDVAILVERPKEASDG